MKIHPILRKLEKAIIAFHGQPAMDELVPEYGAHIVDGAIVYEIEYRNNMKNAQYFAAWLKKALKAGRTATVSVEPYTDNSMVSIVIKSEVSA
jgi:hypothetical protein